MDAAEESLGAAVATADPEAEYFQSIEEFFVARRGDPLLLSNADWVLIRKWREAGIPLRVVVRGIQDALDAHAHSFNRKRKVGSLRYCEGEVAAARERWYRALSLGRDEGTDLEALLLGLAERVLAPDVPAALRGVLRETAAGLRERARAVGDPASLDAWLREREKALLDSLRETAGKEGLALLEAQIDADLAPYRERMPAHVLAQVRAESLARRALERYGLPRLTLFDAGSPSSPIPGEGT
jgi:hypothetical protein